MGTRHLEKDLETQILQILKMSREVLASIELENLKTKRIGRLNLKTVKAHSTNTNIQNGDRIGDHGFVPRLSEATVEVVLVPMILLMTRKKVMKILNHKRGESEKTKQDTNMLK